MPIHLRVPMLKEMTADQMTDTLVVTVFMMQTVSEAECMCSMQDLIEYFQDVPVSVCEDIIRRTFRREDLDPDVRLSILRLMLRPQCKALSTGMFPESSYVQLLDIIASQGTTLTYLNLKGVWPQGEQLNNLQEVIRNLPHLIVLKIPHVANDDVLATIGQHSHHLCKLDISGETDISRGGIEAFIFGIRNVPQFPLKVLSIGNPGEENIRTQDIALLINALPNLISLGCYSFVGSALTHTTAKETMLQYVHDTLTDSDRLQVISKLCPKLHSLYIDTPKAGVISSLFRLPQLRELKLNCFSCDELEKFLQQHENNLTSLELIVGRGDALNLHTIAARCPKLTTFECLKMTSLTHRDLAPFPCLEMFKISQAPITTISVSYVLSQCPQIKEFFVDYMLEITDGEMEELLRKTSFEHLEVFYVGSARNLTTNTVLLLLECCPMLGIIGNLGGWNVPPESVLHINQLIRDNNLDVNLVYLEY
ncbi:hypothetical protein PR048_029560 [Dryococelus australis]|uniref:Uncharacterized protein n=1 Tax=Dryococelus australis TaxID=614101 RepID=A0ABQ9GFX7_9NEOP|nr:hypothetical protein PR048_029560 [Dryococelus australis]